MYTPYRIIKIALCGPSDVRKELDVAGKVVTEWNIQHGDALGTMIKVQHWITDSAPDMSERGQAIINKQMIDESEIVIAIFWSRFGTPTGHAQSGTEEEVRRAMARGVRIMLYFSEIESIRTLPDPAQFGKLQVFKSEMIATGLAGSFKSRKDFEKMFRCHLAKGIHEILAKKTIKAAPAKRAKSHKQTVEGLANVQVGGDVHAPISITLNTQAPKGKPTVNYPVNSIGADADLTNYIEYLCGLWVKYMDPIGSNTDTLWARIGKQIKTKFRLQKRTRNHLSAKRFQDLVEFLVIDKLPKTSVGKKHLKNGTKLCRTFLEFRDGIM